jgi:hypothetical protein
MTTLDLSKNKLTRGKFHGRNGGDNPRSYDNNYETDMSGVAALANAVRDIGALTKLDMSKNNTATREAGKALGEALKGNTVLKELDVSGAGYFTGMDGPGFAEEISKGLSDNRAISHIISESPQQSNPRRASPRVCEDHAGQGEARHSLWLEQRRDRA